jgi:Tol biopolymer transport system component
MVTDGPRIYFSQFRPGGTTLSQVAATGGETSLISSPVKEPMIQDISPDHSSLLVASATASGSGNTALWELPLPTGSPRRLGDLEGNFASPSPDGKQIVFSQGKDLYLANADGTSPHRMLSMRGLGRRASVTPTQLTTGPLLYSLVLPDMSGEKIFVQGLQQRGQLVRYDPHARQFRSLSRRNLRQRRGLLARWQVGRLQLGSG